MLYWILKNLFLAPYLNATFRPWVSGIENVPATGAVILASNHVSVVDSLFLPLMLKRKVTFLAKSDYFTGKGIKGFAIRSFMNGVGQLSDRPLRRQGERGVAQHGRAGAAPRRACSGSTPRARAAPPASSTAVAPASPG